MMITMAYMAYFACSSVMAAIEAPEPVLVDDPGCSQPSLMLRDYLMGKALEADAARREAYEAMKTPEDVVARQEKMRAFFSERIGGLPAERGPVPATVTGRIEAEGYHIEKLILESQPGFYMPALLYMPAGEPPFPGVLVPCGHTANGKAGYQPICVMLAIEGFAVLCYDPVDQGERMQLLTAEGAPVIQGTTAHMMLGVGSILLGRGTATFRIWDGLRAMDYLAGRPEVDASRLGCTGNSGGGTLTSYLMALDPRIQCAAPSCYLTTFKRLLETIGPQDAEQDIYGQIAFGMDHADYIIMRAPKPTFMCAATRDFFDISGTWDTFRQAKRAYTRLGYPERVELAEADEEHGFTAPLRQAAARWMARWLQGRDEAITEVPFTPRPDAELQCTPSGQVQLMDGARTAYLINAELESGFAEGRKQAWSEKPVGEMLEQVRAIAGIRLLGDIAEPEVSVISEKEYVKYTLVRLIFRPEPGIVLPAWYFKLKDAGTRQALYVNGLGKDEMVKPGGFVEACFRAGASVLAVDVRGTGETTPTDDHKEWCEKYGPGWKETFMAYLLERSMLGMRAEDILVCARWLGAQGGAPVELMAVGEMGPPAIHAAALQPELFSRIRIEGSIEAWADVVLSRETRNQFVNVVHGALRVYDLPDLAAALPEALKLSVTHSIHPDGTPR